MDSQTGVLSSTSNFQSQQPQQVSTLIIKASDSVHAVSQALVVFTYNDSNVVEFLTYANQSHVQLHKLSFERYSFL